MPNPLASLTALGQSVWLDYIRRDLFTTGELDRMIRDESLRGMTSNPTIFAQAISGSNLYDEDVRRAPAGESVARVFERIAVVEIRRAADAFRPVYDATKAEDGYVSIEVAPTLANDTQGTIAEARRLWAACDRPNVMIKIPGTKAGLPAIETCLADGINVNVTLLFTVERYREVMNAWLAALEKRAAASKPIDRVASVASFFVSRVDTNVDKKIAAKLATLTDADQKARLAALKAKTAIANAKLAYRAWEQMVRDAPRFAKLKALGARPQRPLWASTSTKDEALGDVYYVEALVAKDTVNTIPPATYAAYLDHGKPAIRITSGVAEAEAAIRTLGECGIDFAKAGVELEDEGVKKFADSYAELLKSIETKRDTIKSR